MTEVVAPDLSAAIASTETRLLRALNEGLQQVSSALTNLSEMHHRAMLEQERRNASFATVERLDALAVRVDSVNAALSGVCQRLENVEAGLARSERESSSLRRQLNESSVSSLTTATGYLVTALLLIGSNILTFILAHVVVH
ncbi:MAG TPA: hypothetical protein VFB58_01125 [Chloroflexota bacterium]|nr:hypothetical protein [Chloroflexota bacterium]